MFWFIHLETVLGLVAYIRNEKLVNADVCVLQKNYCVLRIGTASSKCPLSEVITIGNLEEAIKF